MPSLAVKSSVRRAKLFSLSRKGRHSHHTRLEELENRALLSVAPHAVPDFYNLAGGAVLNIAAAQGVLANDTDGDGHALTAAVARQPAFGALTLNADGSLTYTPGPNFTRWDSFQYLVRDPLADGNKAIVTITNGQAVVDDDDDENPHPPGTGLHIEHDALFDLAPRYTATHTAVASGDWTSPATWEGGTLPVDAARVLIPAGTTVTVDDQIANTPAVVRVEGSLRFDPSHDTQLQADTVLVYPGGTFEMGTAANPIAQSATARLVIADSGDIDRVWDPLALSRGYISHGVTSIHGATATPFVALQTAPLAGTTQLVLAAAPTNWSVADQIVVAGTSRDAADNNQSEVRTILAIAGTSVSIAPLSFSHATTHPNAKVHVAHLSRNAIIESENSALGRRGHVMFMHNRSVNVAGAGFYELGRTNKLEPVNDSVLLADGSLAPGTGLNPRGRYAMHFHLTGTTISVAAASVTGSVVTGSRGWGFVNHSSRVDFADNVAYNVDGAAYVTETGDETGSFRRNIAIHSTGSGDAVDARTALQDFGHQGDGFWFQGGGIAVEDNVAAAQAQHGFIFFTDGLMQDGVKTRFASANLADPSIAQGSATMDVEDVPIQAFRRNTVYATDQAVHTQFHLRSVAHTARSVLEDTLIWNADTALRIPYTKQMTLRNVEAVGDPANPFNYGIDGNDVTENILAENLRVVGFEIGMEVPRRGQNVIDGGYFENIVNFELIQSRKEPRWLSLAGDFDMQLLEPPPSMSLTPAFIRMVQPLTSDGGFDHVFRSESVTFDYGGATGQHVYSAEQAADFIPFPAPLAGLPAGYVGKTNQQLWTEFGKAVGGQVAPATAVPAPGIIGLVEPPFNYLHDPIATDDAYSLWQGVPWSESHHTGVLANDRDPNGQPITAVLDAGPTHGTLDFEADGAFTYTPSPTYVGDDTFSYHVTNGTGNSLIATVTLTMQPASPDFIVTVKEVASGRNFSVADLAIGQPLFIDYYEMDDNVESHSTALAGSKILQTAKADRYFAPAEEDAHDEDYLRFHLNQNATVYVGYHPEMLELPHWLGQDEGWRVTGQELISQEVRYVLLERTVAAGDVALGFNAEHDSPFTPPMYVVAIKPHGTTPVNNPPHAAGDVYDLTGGTSLNVSSAQGLLANDLDAEADALNATLTKQAIFGAVTLNPDGSFNYVPGPDFTQWDSFQYQVSDGQAAGNATLVTILNGQPLEDPGHPHGGDGDDVRRDEHLALLALVARHTATHTAVASGNWSAPSTWAGGVLPIDNANVLIPVGITVTVDTQITQTLRTVRVDGVLRFDPTVDTILRADTTVVTPGGRFEMGTATTPIEAGVRARLIVADRGTMDRVWDPHGLSRGFIAHGTTVVYGTPVTPFLPLLQAPRAGDTQLILDGVPDNWNVGDQIVLAGTGTSAALNGESELLTILGISGNVVSVQPLARNHVPPASGLQVHVAHLTRNAVFESENPNIATRGHIMFMHSDLVDVNNAGIYHVGRTNKLQPANDSIVLHDGVLVPGRGTNPRGRYAAHFHRTGIVNDGTPAVVAGNAVWDSFGWGFVNHSSNAIIRDNVAYDVDGAAFVTETGDEIGSFEHNIAIHTIGSGAGLESRNDIQDFGHQGDGFWFQGGGVHVVDNVAASNREQGFIFFTEGLRQAGIGTTRFLSANLPDPSIANGNTTINVINTPIVEFRGNTSYGTRDGLHSQYHLLFPSHSTRSVIEDFTAWNVTNGINSPYTKHTDIRNVRLLNDVSTPRAEGFDTNDVTEDIHFYDVTIVGFVDGIEVPQQGDNVLEGGLLHNRNNIEMDKMRADHRSMSVSGVTFRLIPPPTGGASYNVQMEQLLTGDMEDFSHVFLRDALYIDNGPDGIQQVWHPEQARGFVPFPTGQTGLPPEYVGLTNQQLWDQFGIAVGGELAPAGAFSIPGIRGLLTSVPYFARPVAVADEYVVNEDGLLTTRPPGTETFAQTGSVWKYLGNGTNQGTAWRAIEINDASWASGPSELGYGDSDEATTVGFIDTDPITAGTQRNFTTYFRRSFNVANVDEITSLAMQLLRDDGASVYLNGVEVVRSNMPGVLGDNTITFTSPAVQNIAGGDEDTYHSYSINPSYLVEGTNVLAVEVHQQNAGSPDISFDLRLVATRTGSGVTVNDVDDFGPLTGILVTPPSHAASFVWNNGVFSYEPEDNFFGADTLEYMASDGTSNSNVITVTINVLAINDAPTARAGGPYTTLINVAVQLNGTASTDPETAAAGLTYEWDLDYNGITFQVDATGVQPSFSSPTAFAPRTIGLRVTDPQSASHIATTTLEVTAPSSATIASRRIYYNNSAWDSNSSVAGAADDGAIAPDKTALLPGGTGSLANYTSFSKGITGIMVDVMSPAGTISVTDFAFKTGNSNNTASWTPLATAPTVTLRPGAGVGGSTRVSLTWPEGTIRKTWLQVTMLANANTGLAANDVFYFGNAVGEAGNSAAGAQVDAADELAARGNPRNLANPAPVTFLYDYNRDKQVNAADQLISRGNPTNLATALRLIAPTAGAGAPPAGAGLAEALLGASVGDELDPVARILRKRAF